MKLTLHRKDSLRKLLLFALFGLAVSCAAALEPKDMNPSYPKKMVAMTFDDLPMSYPTGAADPFLVAADVNRKILAALRRYRAPAIGFVTERNIRALGNNADSLLADWSIDQFELGNHGANHADANNLDLAAIEREIVDGQTTAGRYAERAGRKLKFFRFPFNHLGDSSEKYIGSMELLRKYNYQLAASTIDTSDYIFENAFVRALSNGDTVMQARIKEAYLEYTKTKILYYGNLNRQVLGYEPPAIMLLHTNRINAATMDSQLALLVDAGYRFVSLSVAQADPAYAAPPTTPTRFGPMWGYRWARDRNVQVNGALDIEPARWVVDYGAGKTAN